MKRKHYSALRIQREYAAMLDLYGKGERNGTRQAFARMREEVELRPPPRSSAWGAKGN